MSVQCVSLQYSFCDVLPLERSCPFPVWQRTQARQSESSGVVMATEQHYVTREGLPTKESVRVMVAAKHARIESAHPDLVSRHLQSCR